MLSSSEGCRGAGVPARAADEPEEAVRMQGSSNSAPIIGFVAVVIILALVAAGIYVFYFMPR
jgi:hypothetical protein